MLFQGLDIFPKHHQQVDIQMKNYKSLAWHRNLLLASMSNFKAIKQLYHFYKH